MTTTDQPLNEVVYNLLLGADIENISKKQEFLRSLTTALLNPKVYNNLPDELKGELPENMEDLSMFFDGLNEESVKDGMKEYVKEQIGY